MLNHYIDWSLNNFGLFMFVVAMFFIIVHKLIVRQRVSEYEIVYRWMVLFPLGFTAIYSFVIYVFYPESVGIMLGWGMGAAEFELAIANLALGLVAVLSFNASYNFRLATVIANTVFLFGVAFTHIYKMSLQSNFMVSYAGSWLWLHSLILPLVLWICIIGLRKGHVRSY